MTDANALSLVRAAIITAGAGWGDTPQGFTAAGLCHGVGQLDDIPGIESVDNIHLEPLGSRVILHCPKKCRSETLAAKLVEYLPDATELLTDDWQEAAALLTAHRDELGAGMKEAAQPLQFDGLRTKARLPHADIGSDGEDVAAASAHGLMTGALELWQLSPGLQQLYALGYHYGRASLQPRLAQAEHEAALAYERLHNPGKKFTEMVNRRVSQAAEANASEPNARVFYERVLAAACMPRGGAA